MKTVQTCRICEQEKPLDEFHRNRRWRAAYCKVCQKEYYTRYQKEKGEEIRAQKREYYKSLAPNKKWERHLIDRYGITVEDWNKLSEQQGGVCAICGGESQRTRLSVDHCHETGAVRGLLCERCNSLLGRVKDEPEILERAAAYLRGWVSK